MMGNGYPIRAMSLVCVNQQVWFRSPSREDGVGGGGAGGGFVCKTVVEHLNTWHCNVAIMVMRMCKHPVVQ